MAQRRIRSSRKAAGSETSESSGGDPVDGQDPMDDCVVRIAKVVVAWNGLGEKNLAAHIFDDQGSALEEIRQRAVGARDSEAFAELSKFPHGNLWLDCEVVLEHAPAPLAAEGVPPAGWGGPPRGISLFLTLVTVGLQRLRVGSWRNSTETTPARSVSFCR